MFATDHPYLFVLLMYAPFLPGLLLLRSNKKNHRWVRKLQHMLSG